MVMKRFVIPILFVSVLSGCYDRFQGPSFRNEFGTTITVTIEYADGSISSQDWSPCFEAFAGKTEKPGDAIQEVRISKQGETIYKLNASQVGRLLEREDAYKGYSAWSIGPKGVQFVTSPDSQRCSKGKRIE